MLALCNHELLQGQNFETTISKNTIKIVYVILIFS